MNIRSALAALALCSAVTGCASVVDLPFSEVPMENDTIVDSGGGSVWVFAYAAREILRMGRHVRIDGSCDSACALFADLARPNVCITDRAVFGFHQLTITAGPAGATETREPPPASPDIKAWVDARGGFPSEGLLVMNANEAIAFWPLCG
ncbi:MAG: hypothetical protein G01um101491_452 [Parcubacteria group bacterium Gr01-1014_91]|nr:MAG: hypothetical protein G01um101491_452 [Parcubacteria group bacterium Gr01-1014_91]